MDGAKGEGRAFATPEEVMLALDAKELTTQTKIRMRYKGRLIDLDTERDTQDVIKATVFLVGDPAKGGEIDFAGLNAAWSETFGTAAQPNKPARSTVKVAGLVAPGALVEIEFVAAR